MKTNLPFTLSRDLPYLFRESRLLSLAVFFLILACSSVQAVQPPGSEEEIKVYGLYFSGTDAEGLEQSYWIALFAGTEEEYRNSRVHEMLQQKGKEEWTTEQIQMILDEVGVLYTCFAEGDANRNCLYYCDPVTRRKVKRICFLYGLDGVVIAVTIDSIIHGDLTSQETMRFIATSSDYLDHIENELIAEKGAVTGCIFPGGNEYPPN